MIGGCIGCSGNGTRQTDRGVFSQGRPLRVRIEAKMTRFVQHSAPIENRELIEVDVNSARGRGHVTTEGTPDFAGLSVVGLVKLLRASTTNQAETDDCKCEGCGFGYPSHDDVVDDPESEIRPRCNR